MLDSTTWTPTASCQAIEDSAANSGAGHRHTQSMDTLRADPVARNSACAQAAAPVARNSACVQAQAHGSVRVEYYRLEPGTFVAFTPQSKEFQAVLQETGVDLELLLQSTLMRHTALSEGDWIPVAMPEAPGAEGSADGTSPQWLQVCALKPAPHVSLVDTDMEAEITPSAEFMERVAEEQARARAEADRVAALEAKEAWRQAEAAAVWAACVEPGQCPDCCVSAMPLFGRHSTR
jgi:hypothetical protein